jgi:hypothetical protein
MKPLDLSPKENSFLSTQNSAVQKSSGFNASEESKTKKNSILDTNENENSSKKSDESKNDDREKLKQLFNEYPVRIDLTKQAQQIIEIELGKEVATSVEANRDLATKQLTDETTLQEQQSLKEFKNLVAEYRATKIQLEDSAAQKNNFEVTQTENTESRKFEGESKLDFLKEKISLNRGREVPEVEILQEAEKQITQLDLSLKTTLQNASGRNTTGTEEKNIIEINKQVNKLNGFGKSETELTPTEANELKDLDKQLNRTLESAANRQLTDEETSKIANIEKRVSEIQGYKINVRDVANLSAIAA